MASRVFAVDLGAWSVKLVIASPGIRGAMPLTVVERLVPPGDEPSEVRAKAVLAQLISELRLKDDTGYIGVYGDQVFAQRPAKVALEHREPPVGGRGPGAVMAR